MDGGEVQGETRPQPTAHRPPHRTAPAGNWQPACALLFCRRRAAAALSTSTHSALTVSLPAWPGLPRLDKHTSPPAQMAAEHRRASAVSSPKIPPAPPPLPLPKKSRSYFERFVAQPLTTAYSSRPPTVQPDRARLPNPLVPKVPGVRTPYSQHAAHKTGLDISALDVNRERTHAVLAGKEILKTVRVDDARIVDETNLRAAVLNYADSQARQREGLGIHDVKWSHGQFSSHIATAAANGKVILYDLNRASVELTRLHEHTRQVHKLAFNPHQGHLLLSASHDSTVRLWDLRDMRRDATICPSRDQYHGMNGGIRDVQWSPTDAVEFAFGTDNGTIQRWDFRYPKGPKQKITAHDQRICTSIDWHPDGKHLLSAGVDRTVKVWDFSVTGRRQKAAHVLHTPFPVYKARWRPPSWSEDHHSKGVYQCTQLATSYDREHSAIHVWDFRRPFLPFREVDCFTTAPSDMLWHSRDTLWAVGREGIFQQNDVHHSPKTIDRRNLQAFAISPTGEIGAVAQKRPHPRSSAGLPYVDESYLGDSHGRRHSSGKASLRHSADDSLDDSFLASAMKRHHARAASNRSTKSFSTTPPSDVGPKVMLLSDSMVAHSDSLKPNQVALRGMLPGTTNTQIFAYLAQKYKNIPLPDPPDLDSFLRIERVFEQNAEYAQRAAFYRLAQSWRIMGVSIAVATRRRAELHRQQRRLHPQTPVLQLPDKADGTSSAPAEAHDKPLAASANPAVRAILGNLEKPPPPSKPPAVIESTSNISTPLARPVRAGLTNDMKRPDLLDIDKEDLDQLPPAVTAPPSQTAKALVPPQNPFSSPQWYPSGDGLDERRALSGSYRASPRIPLSLTPSSVQGMNINAPRLLERHDSGESFTMFSASSDSQKGNSMPSSFASGNSQPNRDQLPVEDWQAITEHSSFGKTRNSKDDDLSKSVSISPTTVPADGKASLDTSGSTNKGLNQADHSDNGERAVRDMEHLRRNNQLLRQDSSDSEALTSIYSSSFDYNIDMEASGTIVPDTSDDTRPVQAPKPPAPLTHASRSAPPVLDPMTEDGLLLSDFMAMHVDAEAGSPYSVVGLLNSILAYHTKALDAQFPSVLLLLLQPLLPQTHSPTDDPSANVANVLNAFSDTFVSLGLSPTQAKAILSTQLSQLIATGINPYQAESILQTYHAQLHSLSLFNAAATLRRLAYPTYPAVYEQALKETQLGLLCLSCQSPINNPKDKMRCESCKRTQAPCPICWAKYPAFEPLTAKKSKSKSRPGFKDRGHRRQRSSLTLGQDLEGDRDADRPSPSVPAEWSASTATLWTWCPLCGHGGHSNCLSTWFADPVLSEGACPTEGCLCDCVQGSRRDAKIEEMLLRKQEKDRSKLVRKGDDWRVKESRAVTAVRNAALDTIPDHPQHSGSGTTTPTRRQ
ncbi:hypothetical protein yc1106_03614 [Curvularia clavata]|uniref:WD repeat protein n=1 Tax=Curvularia clavata TaxID=95742 RepID=A0A9Q8Z702_CURCL|nr:hypothetical protein yc1106_03614 [Curvularia clavata]